MISSTVKVHVLGGAEPEKAVGLELVAKTLASYQMHRLTLSVLETNRLIEMLREAVRSK